jgi:hypothetical protein
MIGDSRLADHGPGQSAVGWTGPNASIRTRPEDFETTGKGRRRERMSPQPALVSRRVVSGLGASATLPGRADDGLEQPAPSSAHAACPGRPVRAPLHAVGRVPPNATCARADAPEPGPPAPEGGAAGRTARPAIRADDSPRPGAGSAGSGTGASIPGRDPVQPKGGAAPRPDAAVRVRQSGSRPPSRPGGPARRAPGPWPIR